MMNIKAPIDLRIPHLIPVRIKQYAFHIFDLDNPDRIDKILQVYYLFLYLADHLLSLNPMSSDYLKITREDRNHLAALKELIKNNDEWSNFRSPGHSINDPVARGNWIFPFFTIYYYDNRCTSIKETLQVLLKGNPFLSLLSEADEVDPDFILPKSLGPGKESKREGKYEIPERVCEKCVFPFHFNFLQDFKDRYSLRPAFIVEGRKFADALESEICDGENDYLQNELNYNLKGEIPKQKQNYDYYFSERNFTIFKHPVGDAVVTAPVGRYHFPELTNWSALANRDIYIFKFKERNMEKSLNELLRVGASIVRDAGKDAAARMHFVIMADKGSPEISENEIFNLTVFELFAKADLHSCKIPPGFMEVYEEYHRRSGPQHSNKYVIEPFLRRNSWMLLTGEEGTGKSYLAMILGAALSTGGKLFFDWKIRRRRSKVLYIVDDEMTDDILDDRKLILNKLYPDNGDNFYIKPVHRLDLLNGGKQEIEKLLIEYGTRNDADSGAVEVLILDHLLKLTANHGDEEELWVQLRDWIENEICKRGITVILLHHEYSGTRMMGSKIIANDAPARIHLSRVESPKDQINFSISVVKNRGGRTDRTERCVSLELKSHPRLIEQKNETPETADKKIFRKMSREERRRLVAELREEMTVGEIAEKLGCSKSSVEKIICDLRRQ